MNYKTQKRKMNSVSDVNDIPKGYNELLREYVVLRKDLDETKQELYASRKNVQLLEVLQNDYQNEVELLQSKLDEEKKGLEEKTIQLEDYNTNLKLKFNAKIQSLEAELVHEEEEKLALVNQIELLRKTNVSIADGEIISKLYDEIYNLKEENIQISEEMKESVEFLQTQNANLEETISVCIN